MALTESERAVCAAIEAMRQRLVDELAAWVAIPTGRGFRPGLHRQRAQLARKLRALGAVTRDAECAPRPTWLEGTDASARGAASAGAGAGEGEGEGATAAAPHSNDHAPVDVLIGEHAGAGPRVLLSGHFDTVHDPHGTFQELTAAREGTATGPGCVDMKGGLVVAFAALEALAKCGHARKWSLVLTPDEELGSFGSTHILQELARQNDVGFVFEPAGEGGTLITERMGAGQFRLDAYGRSAHVGRDPEKGVSAVTALCTAVLKANALSEPAAGRVVNVGPLAGGPATNIVPDHAIAWGNVRFGSPEAERALGSAIDALGTGKTGEVPRVVVQRIFNRPAKPCTPAIQKLADLARACSADLGRELPFGRTGGVCDGNTLQSEGLPVLDTLGVRGGNLHRTDEWMELESMVDRAQLTALLMLRVPDAGIARKDSTP